MSEKIELKDTLNLPQTDFPMRAGLVEREPKTLQEWEDKDLYRKIQEKSADKPVFMLHDGPPFTNGDVHIGTAMNKIMKDTIVKYKTLRGYRAPYIPGWDCHGLPIEHKVAQELRKEKKNQELEAPELRKRCEAFSEKYIKSMTAQFQRLGVLGEWDKPYKTMDPQYEGEILRGFAKMVGKNMIYRSKKPVYWSIPCKTALAEAEIEYKNHVSPSIYVKFQAKDPKSLGIGEEKVYFVIWTTTPWTLPANRALAVHENLKYEAVRNGDGIYIVAADLAETFINECELEKVERGVKFWQGSELEGQKSAHPFIDFESAVVLADYVTTESGTGVVHTAPGHGPDDFITGQKYELEVYCPLDDNGKYEDDGVMPERLVGLSVLYKGGKCPANDEVLKLLEENNTLVHLAKLEHSYPHCWRSKTPVVFRAMPQWFAKLDEGNVRQQALEAISNVKWVPTWGENRIRGAVETRPDWCISRQRAWGMPIPVFYDESGEVLLDESVVNAIADKVAQNGSNFWFESNVETLLDGVTLPVAFEDKKLTKGTDTLDVWIDSGSSHMAVLKKHPELTWPADLYFEGTDQHRGWFQSSLWTGVITQGKAPYKEVITHGFIVNEDKTKISKSDKKPQTAQSYVEKYGVDILRLWVSSEDYRSDVPISDGILKQIVQTYRTIRNTLRFQLGNLYDFDQAQDRVKYEEMTLIDQWALKKLADLIQDVTQAYDEYEFHRGYQYINRFCTVVLSATYHDILKDRLYTFGPKWIERRSSQTAIDIILSALLKLMAPVLVFTTEEAYNYYKGKESDSIHLQEWPQVEAEWLNETAENGVEAILKVREQVNEQLESMRQKKKIGQSLDAQVIISGPQENNIVELLKARENELPELFIVSQVTVNPEQNNDLKVEVKHAQGIRCPRSWRWVEKLENAGNFGEVSSRCRKALEDKYSKTPLSQL